MNSLRVIMDNVSPLPYAWLTAVRNKTATNLLKKPHEKSIQILGYCCDNSNNHLLLYKQSHMYWCCKQTCY